jgi:hypothetical protein
MRTRRYLAEARRGQGVEAERTFVRGDSASSELSDEQLAEFIKQARRLPSALPLPTWQGLACLCPGGAP